MDLLSRKSTRRRWRERGLTVAADTVSGPDVAAGATARDCLSITMGCERDNSQGRRVRLDAVGPDSDLGRVLAAANPDAESWFSLHCWARDYRTVENWESASGVMIDGDYLDAAGVHTAPPPETAEAMGYLLADGGVACSAWYATPHGCRVIFLFREQVADARLYRAAAGGAVTLVERALGAAGLLGRTGRAGYTVDRSALDLAHIFFVPCCRRRGEAEPRRSELVLGAAEAPFEPAELARLTTEPAPKVAADEAFGPIHEGARNNTLFRLGCSMRAHGFTAEAILAALLAENAAHCAPPLPDEEVVKIAASVARYEPGGARTGGAAVVTVADVKSERVQWLWPGRVPLGKLTLFAGDPGVGKSTVALDLTARVSVGTEMPDCEPATVSAPAAVVLLSGEDGLADTIRPRLEAAGADLQRVHVIKWVTLAGGQEAAPSLPRDSAQIEKIVAEKAAKLLVIDPLMAFLGSKIDSWKDQSIRGALAPLHVLAERSGAAVVAIVHLNKRLGTSALHRSGGSVGLVAAARSVLLFGHDPDDTTGDRRVVAPAKANLSKFAASLAYAIVEGTSGAGQIRWLGRSPHDAAALLAPRLQEHSVLAAAMDALRVLLASGEMPAKQAMGAMQKCGFAESTIKRAKKALRVGERKDGHGPWYWSLQDDPLDPLAHQGGQEPPENTEEDQGDQDSHMGQGDQHSQTPLAAFDYVPAECYRAQSFGRLYRARGQT